MNKEVLTYMNDIFIMKKTKKEHREKTRRILRKLLKTRLRIKLSKSEFKKKEVKFLKHIIKKKEIKSDSKKVKTLRK